MLSEASLVAQSKNPYRCLTASLIMLVAGVRFWVGMLRLRSETRFARLTAARSMTTHKIKSPTPPLASATGWGNRSS